MASLKEREKEEGEKSIFDRVWFNMKTAVLEGAAMYAGSISHVDNKIIRLRSLESLRRPSCFLFGNVLLTIYGQSGPSLLMESTDSTIVRRTTLLYLAQLHLPNTFEAVH